MSFKKISLVLDDHLNSVIDLGSFNPNFTSLKNYVLLIFDDEEKLLVKNNEKFYYDDKGRLSKIIFTDLTLDNVTLTYVSTFDYFDENVLKKTMLIKSENYFSANNLAYTTDGENIKYDYPENYNRLINSEILTYDHIRDLLEFKLYFSNEVNYDYFKFNSVEEEVSESNDNFIFTSKLISTKYGNEILFTKKYTKFFSVDDFLLTEIDVKVIYKNDASYGIHYDENGKPRDFDETNWNQDEEADYYRDYVGKHYYNYDNNGNLNFIENINEIGLIKSNLVEGIKIEEGVIIRKSDNTVNPWFTLHKTKIDTLDIYNY